MYEGKRLLLEKVSLLHHSEPTKSPASLFSDHEFFVPQDDGNNKPGIVIKLENGKIGVVCRQ